VVDGFVMNNDYMGGTLIVDFTEVPAPGALALLGLAGIATRRRRK
jgi:MYXO-CTERM domain-containing protein